MTRDLRLYIEDILASVDRIEEYTRGFDEQSFSENAQTQDAVLRRLEVMGEAVKTFRNPCEGNTPKSLGGGSQACATF